MASLVEAEAQCAVSQAKPPDIPQHDPEMLNGQTPVHVHATHAIVLEEEEKVPLEEDKVLPARGGNEHESECERCREALGMRRRHETGKSLSTKIMSI